VPSRLYVIAEFELHYRFGGGRPIEKARALGFVGDIWKYDTAALKLSGLFHKFVQGYAAVARRVEMVCSP